jgi:hypothetical protein
MFRTLIPRLRIGIVSSPRIYRDSPDTQHFLANRMRSSVVTVASDHAPMARHADTIAELVARACAARGQLVTRP